MLMLRSFVFTNPKGHKVRLYLQPTNKPKGVGEEREGMCFEQRSVTLKSEVLSGVHLENQVIQLDIKLEKPQEVIWSLQSRQHCRGCALCLESL